MANNVLTIELETPLSGRVRDLAQASGASIEVIVERAISGYVNDWSETLQRLAEFDRTGESLSAAEVLTEFKAAVHARKTAFD